MSLGSPVHALHVQYDARVVYLIHFLSSTQSTHGISSTLLRTCHKQYITVHACRQCCWQGQGGTNVIQMYGPRPPAVQTYTCSKEHKDVCTNGDCSNGLLCCRYGSEPGARPKMDRLTQPSYQAPDLQCQGRGDLRARGETYRRAIQRRKTLGRYAGTIPTPHSPYASAACNDVLVAFPTEW
jgi:hypothetical protein